MERPRLCSATGNSTWWSGSHAGQQRSLVYHIAVAKLPNVSLFTNVRVLHIIVSFSAQHRAGRAVRVMLLVPVHTRSHDPERHRCTLLVFTSNTFMISTTTAGLWERAEANWPHA